MSHYSSPRTFLKDITRMEFILKGIRFCNWNPKLLPKRILCGYCFNFDLKRILLLKSQNVVRGSMSLLPYTHTHIHIYVYISDFLRKNLGIILPATEWPFKPLLRSLIFRHIHSKACKTVLVLRKNQILLITSKADSKQRRKKKTIGMQSYY